MTFLFCFLDKTLLMAPSLQINSFLNDFRLCFIYQNIVLIVVLQYHFEQVHILT